MALILGVAAISFAYPANLPDAALIRTRKGHAANNHVDAYHNLRLIHDRCRSSILLMCHPVALGFKMSKRPEIGFAALLTVVAGFAVFLTPDYLALHSSLAAAAGVEETFWIHLLTSAAFVAAVSIGFASLFYSRDKAKLLVNDSTAVILRSFEFGIAAIDDSGIVRFANPMFLRVLGLDEPEVLGRGFDGLVDRHAGRAGPRSLLPQTGQANHRLTVENSGAVVKVCLRTERIEEGGRSGWIAVARDVTAAEDLEQSMQLYSRAMDSSQGGIMIADALSPDLPIVYVNQAVTHITGYSPNDLIGRNCRMLQGKDRSQPEIALLAEALRLQKPITVTLRNYTKAGAMFFNELRLAPAFDPGGKLRHWVAALRDVTALRQATEALERISIRDPLTRLYNRTGFRITLKALLLDPSPGSILYIKLDIEAFHEINTTFGFKAGDALLAQVGERLAAFGPAISARLDGDEFALAIRTNPIETAGLLDRVRAELARNFVVPGATLRVFFHTGFVIGAPGIGVRQLMRQGGAALHEARKVRAREPYEYNEKLDREITRRLRVSGDLQQAVANADLVLHYQPKVDLRTGRIIGAEGLMRWEHPTFGLQLPERFIPAAEHTGLIVPMGEWALRAAAQCAATLSMGRSDACHVSVNVSLMQFRQMDFPSLVESVLSETGLDPQLITLELTESLFAEEIDALHRALWRIRDLGVGLSIDDFGTGYSSLKYIGSFPVTEIKIDRCFVVDMNKSRQKRAVIEAITKLGRSLDVRIVAEGVESDLDREMLIDLGCDQGQGYFFSMPLVEEDFTWLAAQDEPLPVRVPIRPVMHGAL